MVCIHWVLYPLPSPLTPIVMDDDQMEVITAKSVVTLSVSLRRTSLQAAYGVLYSETTPPDQPRVEQVLLSVALCGVGVSGCGHGVC